MKKVIYMIFIAAISMLACDKPTVGFLNVEDAAFDPDFLIISDLDLNNPDDLRRQEESIPWVSYAIQGVDGTRPISYSIENISKVGGGDVAKITEVAIARGDGAVEIALDNDIEEGEYHVFIRVTNEGYSKVVSKPLRVIVE